MTESDGLIKSESLCLSDTITRRIQDMACDISSQVADIKSHEAFCLSDGFAIF
jgi:hypothetical protein